MIRVPASAWAHWVPKLRTRNLSTLRRLEQEVLSPVRKVTPRTVEVLSKVSPKPCLRLSRENEVLFTRVRVGCVSPGRGRQGVWRIALKLVHDHSVVRESTNLNLRHVKNLSGNKVAQGEAVVDSSSPTGT